MRAAQISDGLNLEPRVSRDVGSRRATPRGEILPGVNEMTFWCSQEVRGNGLDLAKGIASHLRDVEAHSGFLTEFSESGGKIEYFVGWFSGDQNTGEVFDWDLLRRLSELRISLAFDVYGGSE